MGQILKKPLSPLTTVGFIDKQGNHLLRQPAALFPIRARFSKRAMPHRGAPRPSPSGYLRPPICNLPGRLLPLLPDAGLSISGSAGPPVAFPGRDGGFPLIALAHSAHTPSCCATDTPQCEDARVHFLSSRELSGVGTISSSSPLWLQRQE